ncbi:hypothetical protein [Streptomyces sp. NPDC005209]|uniref:hypothetical protein n=1 Tax=Streptomyces sp. NPDC005209 TaxID=3156715 RepID=UPI0033AE806B
MAGLPLSKTGPLTAAETARVVLLGHRALTAKNPRKAAQFEAQADRIIAAAEAREAERAKARRKK